MVYQETLFPDVYQLVAEGLGIPLIWAIVLIAIIMIWSLIWKGLALWHSSRRRQLGWFLVLLVVNTLGILEIVYLFTVIKLKISNLFSDTQ